MNELQFSNEELANLMIFLNRVQLTGAEADVFVMLKLKVRTAIERAGAEEPEQVDE